MFLPLTTSPDFQIAGSSPPQATLFIPTRNRPTYIKPALLSALNQTGIVLEILILDDASNDNTPDLVVAILQQHRSHPHTVKFWKGKNRRANNVTAALIAQASCDFCIAQHDDDISLPHRALRLYQTHLETRATVVSSATTIISPTSQEEPDHDLPRESGFVPIEDIVRSEALGFHLAGATIGFDRAALQSFPRLDTDYLVYTHDRLTSFRGALLGGVYLLPERLLQYRNHQGQWVNRQTDYQSADTARANNLATFLALSLAMERDLDALPPASSPHHSHDIPALRHTLHAYRQSLLSKYIATCENLHRQGYRPLWVEQRVFDQLQLEYAQARFWSRGHWRKLRFWLRSLKNLISP